ncbi:SAM-dependent methyltransferase [Streptomyces sp. RY43-2]|uniref:SAM-dependent methyltransferase n=1 Tax=Streptomyces macrolidinus TaxID=2952607 RepID=A0ABT0ZF13_9ACTN|nr:SAM-dependent methyltransferase [Streptomyces macrolidinus]MCN9242169.1 SAM-dependent methyltransferase [Streptomyces macrolidinus]
MAQGTPDVRVDTGKPHPARVYDCLLGGKDHYAVDEEMAARLPENAFRDARLNRAFMHRAMRWLAGRGIDQFLDVGTGIPTEPNLHQIVQGVNPRCRVAYTDNDPIVLRHAEALLVSTPEGATDYIQADVRRPAEVLAHARAFLDFGRPLALSLIALLHFIPDDEDADGIVRTLVDALPSGSHLVLTHGTGDFHPELAGRATGDYGKGGIRLALRSHAEVLRFFAGLDLVDPGLVTAPAWHQDTDTPAPQAEESSIYVGVARVP